MSAPAVQDPTELQLAAYNARDIEAFVACYHEEVIVEDALGALLLRGQPALRERYGTMFARYPELRCEVVGRMYAGDFVVHEERVHGRAQHPEVVIAIYRVAHGRITHVRFLR